MMKRYVDITIRIGGGDLSDKMAELATLNALRKAAPWLDVVSVNIVPLEPCECGGYKRKGALMCDECAGGVTR